MNKKLTLSIITLIITLVSGCASGMHGYTKSQARNQYMQVMVENDSFGYKRIKYIAGFRGAAIKSFLEENGYPDYLYEYKSEKREGFIFYYIENNKAYDFREKNWQPDSASIIEIREINEFERKRFGIE
jgi:hypothetical protein